MEILLLIKQIVINLLTWLVDNPGIVAAFIALFGVFRTIKATDKRDSAKLEADIKHKDKEREVALRKDVYLAAASGMIKANKYLGAMANAETFDHSSINQLDEFFAANAKIEIVGSNDTIERMDAVMRQFSESHYTLLMGALHLSNIDNEIRITNDEIDQKMQSYNRLVASMNQEEIRNSAEITSLHYDIVALGQNVNTLENSLPGFKNQYRKMCMKESLKISRLIYPAVIAVRKELHLELDVDRYAALKKDSLDKIDRDVDEFLTKLEQMH